MQTILQTHLFHCLWQRDCCDCPVKFFPSFRKQTILRRNDCFLESSSQSTGLWTTAEQSTSSCREYPLTFVIETVCFKFNIRRGWTGTKLNQVKRTELLCRGVETVRILAGRVPRGAFTQINLEYPHASF